MLSDREQQGATSTAERLAMSTDVRVGIVSECRRVPRLACVALMSDVMLGTCGTQRRTILIT